MDKLNVPTDLYAFGFQVKTFPVGIGEAFTSLMQMIPNGESRSYFGISYCEDGHIIYHAAAHELEQGEKERYKCQGYTIDKGDYLTVTIKDWRNNLDAMKDVFHNMMQDERVAEDAPCIEWYKDDNEMLCMMRMASSAQ